MAQPTAQEQLMLELVNRARANPNQEATRQSISLNQGLSAGRISSGAKQPLAFNLDLIDSSRAHSRWMLNTDTFSHTGSGGSSAGDRMRAADYTFTGSWTWGENIAWRGTSGTPNLTNFVAAQHDSLFKSPGHRTNILGDNFREIGIGAITGEFKGYNAVMTTQNFAKSGNDFFLTGVAFDDSVTPDDFYTVGEGLGDINVQAVRQSDNRQFSTTTFDSGGYQLALDPGTYNVTFSGGDLNQTVTETVTINNQNVKLNLETDELPQSPPQVSSQPPSNPPEDTNDVIGEYGQVTLNHNWKTISLKEAYDNPVVIVSDPTIKGGDPAAIRLRNVGSEKFQLRLQEPNYKDGRHTNESVSYMVVETGDWKLQDGTRLAAGIHKGEILSRQGFNSINLNGFKATPTVLSQVQTFKDSDWVTTRTTGQSAKRFKVTMQEEEKLNRGSHAQEDIGWFAIDQGTASDGDTLLEGNTTSRSYTHQRANIAFETDFTRTPSVIAKLGSFYGGDTANLRLDNMNANGFGARVQEEKSLDNEIGHTKESVSFLALAGQSGLLTGTSV